MQTHRHIHIHIHTYIHGMHTYMFMRSHFNSSHLQASQMAHHFLGRGGKRQRLDRAFRLEAQRALPAGSAAADSQGPVEGDAEVDLLMELFALGLMPATTVRDICAAAHAVAPRPQTGVMAHLGASGAHASNVYRDLVRKLNMGSIKVAAPIELELPMWSASAAARHEPGRAPYK